MRIKRRLVLLIIIVACVVAAMVITVIFWGMRNRYENSAMVVTWKEGIGKPLTIEGVVLRNDKPVANRLIEVEDSSGGGDPVRTGPDGQFSVKVSELELLELRVEDAGSVEWDLLWGPNLQDGISFQIQLK